MAAKPPPGGKPPVEDIKTLPGGTAPPKGQSPTGENDEVKKPSEERLQIEKPLWDLNTFIGRFQHYLWLTDCRTCLVSDKELIKAKELYFQYKDGQEPEGTTRDQALYAKKLFESAFHPDTHEKQNLFGRMSFQVPGNMFITGIMMTFYKSTAAVVFWQWFNQSFNALVNYTNRNANSTLTDTQICAAYISATTMAVTAAMIFKRSFSRARPLIQRFVPFVAVASANCVNVPLMRQNEMWYGIDLHDELGNPVNIKSKYAPVKGISQVVVSRISMAIPGMLLIPVIMERCWMQKLRVIHMPIQVLLMGAFLVVCTPMGCALFPQNCSINTSTIEKYEPNEYENLKKEFGNKVPEKLYFNKGL